MAHVAVRRFRSKPCSSLVHVEGPGQHLFARVHGGDATVLSGDPVPPPTPWQQGAAASWGLGDLGSEQILSWTGSETHGEPLCAACLCLCVCVFSLGGAALTVAAGQHLRSDTGWPRPLGPHAHTSPLARAFVCSGWWAGAGQGLAGQQAPEAGRATSDHPCRSGSRGTPGSVSPGTGHCCWPPAPSEGRVWEVTVSWAAARPLAHWRASPCGSVPRVLGQCTGWPPVLYPPSKALGKG